MAPSHVFVILSFFKLTQQWVSGLWMCFTWQTECMWHAGRPGFCFQYHINHVGGVYMPVIPPLGSGCRGIQSSKSPLEIQGVPDQPGQHETASQNILMFHYDVSHIHISLYFARMCTHTLLFLSVHPLVYFLPSDGPPSEFPSYIFLKLDSIRGKVGYLTFQSPIVFSCSPL